MLKRWLDVGQCGHRLNVLYVFNGKVQSCYAERARIFSVRLAMDHGGYHLSEGLPATSSPLMLLRI